ncbi:HNH endonuclease signature motif containing protein [Nocardiopsis sp. NPDC058631]|uniref:HNH endonuclease signature motif containing protein n=1 Tax=Nocardiopsis sp. NPDC058631 TaxID=3346566 RepID=UPI003655E53E
MRGWDLCQVDHVTSFSRGGLTVVGNLQPLCGPHNRAKYQRELREEHRRGILMRGQGRTRDRVGPRGLVPTPRPPRED